MKCTYCNKQTNTYQKYSEYISYISPYCQYHINGRTQELYKVPSHIPNNQHQIYLWQKYTQFTRSKELTIG